MYTGSGAGLVDVHQASKHIVNPPHSATSAGYDQLKEWRSIAKDMQLPQVCHSSLHLAFSMITAGCEDPQNCQQKTMC